MPIHQALQLAYALKEQRTGRVHGSRGSDQILGERHVLALLKSEQAAIGAGVSAALALDDLTQVPSRFASDALQFIFGRTPNRRLVVSSFLG